ncbi:MAG TPA: 5'-methylthioadenosine phosphorylase [Gammaproteobacteria bacterium]|nr:5'-methylthioadenosine phosphorylase [Gammaproteobacteria bacterium]
MTAPVAVILGSAFGEPPAGVALERLDIDTPWGAQTVFEARGLGRPAYAIFRHGLPHRLLPHQVNWRAQAAALAALQCRALLVTSSVGVLRPDIPLYEPLLVSDVVMIDNRLPDGSACTMFAEPAPGQGHLLIEEGLCSAALGRQLEDFAHRCGAPVAARVVFGYLCGPRIKTAAENRLWARLGVDVDAMSLAPELVLANELGIPSSALVAGHKYALPDAAGCADTDVAASLRRSRDVQARIVLEFLRTAEPVPFGNRLFAFADPRAHRT